MKPIFFPLLFALLLLVACNKQTNITDFNPYQGIEGVSMELQKNGPPPKVFANETFNVVVKLQNKGAFNVSNAFFDIIYDNYYFDFAPLDSRFIGPPKDQSRIEVSLEGKSLYNQQGSFTTQEVLMKAKPIEGERESPTSTMLFNLCYPYRTLLAAQVCLDSDPFNMDARKKTCAAQPKVYVSQGAPVAVTKVEPRMTIRRDAPDKPALISPTFTITVKNVGKGIIIQQNDEAYYQQCTLLDTKKALWGKANIRVKLSDKPLTCTPELLTFTGDEATTTCRLQNTQENPDGFMSIQFLTQPDVLFVTIDYMYLSVATRTIEISR